MRKFRVYAIKDGTVIDHIPAGKGVEIVELLNLRKWDKVVTVGLGFRSKHLGKKDLVKIENKEFTPEEVNKIAIIAPTATLNIIRNFEIKKKFKVEVPDVIEGIVKCPNPACITNHDHVKTKFFHEKDEKHLSIRCYYCEHHWPEKYIQLI
ncbi:aspartate carbamoyltransferase regulatory subunit [Patescibacteria group bacterium]